MRRLLALTALLGVAAVAPAQARVARPVELTATTVVTATSSGWVDVVVPVDATLSPRTTRNPDVTVSGPGRFVGLWLTRLDEQYVGYPDQVSVTRQPGFLGGLVETFGSTTPVAQCTPVPNATVPVTQDCTNPTPRAILLHEGRYRLRVLADGGRVTFTLRLHGLDRGTTELVPSRRLRSAQQDLVVRESAGSDLVTFGGSVASFPASEALVFAKVTSGGPGTVDLVSVCSRPDDGATPMAFGPTCAGGDGGGYRAAVTVAGTPYAHYGGFSGNLLWTTGPRMSLGGSFAGDTGRVYVAGLGVWLEQP